ITKPASCSSAFAWRNSGRSWPEPSETGGTNGFAEHIIWHLAAEWFEQGKFVRRGLTDRHHVGILKHRMGPLIGPVHDLLVGPFEIECIDEGLPQTLILQFFPSRIKKPTLRARRGIVWNNIALDVPLADRREVVACRPGARGEFRPESIAFGSKSLEGNFAIAVIFVAHDVKIVQPAPDRQVGPPPVFHSLVLNVTARLETSDFVRAAAERYLERGFVEPTGSIIAAREDRERSHEQRHVASSMGRETYHHGRVIGRFRADKVAQQLLGDRMSLVLEDLQREGDVVGGERATIVELDAGPQQKTISEPVGRYLHRARSEAVQRVGLVLGARHQAREGELHPLRTIALKDEAVERIEGEKVLIEGPGCPDVGEHATLRGVWIDVIEMLEVGRIFEIAEGRYPMALGVLACFDIPCERRYEG